MKVLEIHSWGPSAEMLLFPSTLCEKSLENSSGRDSVLMLMAGEGSMAQYDCSGVTFPAGAEIHGAYCEFRGCYFLH